MFRTKKFRTQNELAQLIFIFKKRSRNEHFFLVQWKWNLLEDDTIVNERCFVAKLI